MDPTPLLGVADPISALTHLLGALCFGILGFHMVQRARAAQRAPRAMALYVMTVVAALAASALFHAAPRETEIRDLLMTIDHAAIFLLIAGSYTPIHMIAFTGLMRWGVLTFVWSAALGGVLAKLFWFDSIPEWFGLSLYLGLGWVGLISATALYRRQGLAPLTSLLVGAMAYTIGAMLEFARVPILIEGVIGSHEVFHGFVLLGIAAHWRYIARLAKPAITTNV